MSLKKRATILSFVLVLFVHLSSASPSSSSSGSRSLKENDNDQNDYDIKRGKEYDSSEDFLFDDGFEGELKQDTKSLFSSWSNIDLCKDVECKLNQRCVVKDKGSVLCVDNKKFADKAIRYKEAKVKSSKADTKLSQHSFEKRFEECKVCPPVKSAFFCGTDNATYSSLCRLKFHNCVHRTSVKIACKGFCPCDSTKYLNYNSKYVIKAKGNQHKYKELVKNPKRLYKLEKFKKTMGKAFENSVIRDSIKKTDGKVGCTRSELHVMGTRLVDWFAVVLADQKNKGIVKKKIKFGFKLPNCEKKIEWMFHHFDVDGNMLLSQKELYDLEHDEREKCLRQYLDGCDEDRDTFLNPYEWCSCFEARNKPCIAALKHSKRSPDSDYSPQCDNEGFFRLLQCDPSSGFCWCVDKNGVEFSNTRRKGRPDCDGLLDRAQERSRTQDDEDDAEEDDDDDDDEESDVFGSGDGSNNL